MLLLENPPPKTSTRRLALSPPATEAEVGGGDERPRRSADPMLPGVEAWGRRRSMRTTNNS